MGFSSPASRSTQMECLEIKLTALPQLYLHFRGIASSIRASGSSKLFSSCCGLRLWSLLPVPRHVSSAKTLTRRRRAGRNDVAVQHPQRVGCDRYKRCAAARKPNHSISPQHSCQESSVVGLVRNRREAWRRMRLRRKLLYEIKMCQ